jgi:hypothetical protein
MKMMESVKGLTCFEEKPPDWSWHCFLTRNYLGSLERLLFIFVARSRQVHI